MIKEPMNISILHEGGGTLPLMSEDTSLRYPCTPAQREIGWDGDKR
ncbi:MAG: hypothetical protein WA130_06375 [Candidatus Methanoperedens sp.]